MNSIIRNTYLWYHLNIHTQSLDQQRDNKTSEKTRNNKARTRQDLLGIS